MMSERWSEIRAWLSDFWLFSRTHGIRWTVSYYWQTRSSAAQDEMDTYGEDPLGGSWS